VASQWRSARRHSDHGTLQKSAAPLTAAEASTEGAPKEKLDVLLRVDPLAIEVGLSLIWVVKGGQNSPLLRRIASIRRQLASELGYLLPSVRVTDNIALKVREYTVALKGVEISRFDMPQGCELAIHLANKEARLDGIPTREPTFGLRAFWITPDKLEEARRNGFTVVDTVSIMGAHLAELVRRHAHELFTRQDAKRYIDRVRAENSKAVEDLVPKLLPLTAVHKVLQILLRERVSVRDGGTILEALGEAAPLTRNTALLTEYARQAIRRILVKPYLNASGDLPAYFLDPGLEKVIESAIEHSEHASHIQLHPDRIRDLVDRVSRTTGGAENPAVLVTASASRYFVRQLLEGTLPNVAVISHNEVPPGVKVLSLGIVQ
jgi:flagellar biosynthesis protein FlhA